jgi:hypothetical protein
MPDEVPESKLCEICQRAEATVHICEVHCEVDQEWAKTHPSPMVTHDYCAECAKTRQPKSDFPFPIPESTGPENCYYCGGPPAGGSPNVGPLLTVRKKAWHWTCRRCEDIERRFLNRELRKLLRPASDKETESAIEDLYRRAESYVREALKSGEPEVLPTAIIGEMVVPDPITPRELAARLDKKPHEILMDMMTVDVFVPLDEQLTFDNVSKILRGYGYIAKRAA